MMVGGRKKQGSFFGGKKKTASPLASPPPLKLPSSPSASSSAGTGCCRQLRDCVSMNSIVSASTKLINDKQHQHQQQHLVVRSQQQVEDLEKEVEKQKEMRIMYRKRMERTQDYLRFCLQIAQDNGFLDLIIGNQDDSCCNISSPTGTPHSTSPHLLTSPPPPIQWSPTPNFPSPPSKQQQQQQQHSQLSSLIQQANLSGWYIHPDEIELKEKIAQGSTAEIHKGVWRGLEVAVKCIFPHFFHDITGLNFFAQELDTLSRQRHSFILHFFGASMDPPNHAWVVTESLETTLKEWLHGPGSRNKERCVPLPPFLDRLARAVEISQAMQYLHHQKPNKVIHRDLKPSNIFLDDANHVRVADFGHARFLEDSQMALTGETGTYVYMAPEVISCQPYNEKCDVYSFAIILNEIITGNYPYVDTDFGPSKIAMQVADGSLRPALPADEDGQLVELTDLISLSWSQDPSLRPSFATITSALKQIQSTFASHIPQT
ncbi:Serine/threonine-protein kinase STY17 [Linum grandiflorum]